MHTPQIFPKQPISGISQNIFFATTYPPDRIEQIKEDLLYSLFSNLKTLFF